LNILTSDPTSDVAAYERVERRIRNWAAESRRIEAGKRAFLEQIRWANRRRQDDSGSQTSKAAELVRVFQQKPRKKPLSRKEREALERQRETEREARRQARLAELRMRRGMGQVGKCRHCTRICRGGKCKKCKGNPELITARGKQTRAGPIPEPQPPVTRFSDDAAEIDTIVCNVIPEWAGNALKRSFLWGESTQNAADDLMIPPSQFASRVKAAVLHVLMALAK
jgi:hypothetical protein